MKDKPIKLQKSHVFEEWEDDDGYWIALKSGWKTASDPVGALHTIREDTKPKAWREQVMPCECLDCARVIKRLPYPVAGL